MRSQENKKGRAIRPSNTTVLNTNFFYFFRRREPLVAS